MAFDLAASIEEDFTLFDGTELVTYTHFPPGGAAVATADVLALRRAVKGLEVGGGSGSATDVREVDWHLKANDLPAGQECNAGDTITRATGEAWVVGEVNNLETLRTRWACRGCTRAAR